MKAIELVDEHIIIRETVGYDLISKVELCDLPDVIKFLKIVNNYMRMLRIEDKKWVYF